MKPGKQAESPVAEVKAADRFCGARSDQGQFQLRGVERGGFAIIVRFVSAKANDKSIMRPCL